MKKRTSFIGLIQLWGIISLIGIGVSFALVDIFKTYHDFSLRIEHMRTDHIVSKKKMIKQEVMQVADMISHIKSQSEILTKTKIKTRVYEAYSISQNIYQQYKSVRSKDEIQHMILNVLRSVRFEKGTGYYFVIRPDGVVMLNTNKPELEGKNLLDLKDTNGKAFIKGMIRIAGQSGEGFNEYYWAKPGMEGAGFKKQSFVKAFKPYNWIIGTGLYVDDVEEQIKSSLLSIISRIRFGKEGYIFINRLNGDALISNGKLVSGTKKLWEIFNEHPEKVKNIFKKEYNAALKPDGDYIYYSWIKLTTSHVESPKASFILGIPELQWLVGAGVYLDDVEKDIALLQTELINQIKAKIFYLIIIVIGILSLFLFLFRRVNMRFENDFNLFFSFFSRAAQSDEVIDRNQIQFVEFDRIAEYANKMLSDRRKAEETLWERKRFQERLLNSMTTFISVLDINGNVIFVNNTLLKDSGLKLEEVIGKKFFDTHWWSYSDKARNTIISNVEKCASGESMVHDIQMQKTDGSLMWIEFNMYPIFDENRIVQYLIPEGRDITARKQTETALRKSEKQFHDLFNSITDLIYTQDMDGYFISVNPAMQQLFDYEKEELLGHRASEFMEPEFQTGFSSRYLEVIKKQGFHKGIACYFKKNREKVYIEYESSLVKPDSGEPYISGMGRDVTEKVLSAKKVKELYKQVAQSQKMESIGTLAGGIAHDFNNILFPIVGHTEMLLEDIPEESPFRDSLNQIYTATLRASELVKQILTFSRQKNSELKLVKMQPIIKEALKLIRSTIPTTIEIKQDIQAECGVIKADPTQIHQIIMNLATNAYHAMDETGGKLYVTLKEIKLSHHNVIEPDMKPGVYVCLTIKDTGVGMDEDLTQKIFEPFFTTKEIGKGTGMGLSVVHGIVKSMNGVIKVFSEPDKGTEFNIYLPVVKHLSGEHEIYQMKEPIKGGIERILLVDDEKAVVKMEKLMLERLGYQVTSYSSSIEAIAAFRSAPEKFDLVITDMAMPHLSGDKLSAALIKIRPDIPVLLCTGFSETMSKEKAVSLGIRGFLLKPIVIKELSQKIREVLD